MAPLGKGTGLPRTLKGAGGPIEGYGSDTSAPALAKGMKASKGGNLTAAPIRANKLPTFKRGGSVKRGK